MRVAGLILAGGRGSRMAAPGAVADAAGMLADKALVPLAGRPLLAHVVDRFAPQVDRLALNANGDLARFAGFGLAVLPDPVPGLPGPLAGLLAGVVWAVDQGASHLVSVAVDMPFLPADLVPRLLLAAGASGLAVAETATGRHPTVALWPVSLGAALRAALGAGTRRVWDFAAAQGAVLARFPDTCPDAFANINTPADLAAAETVFRKSAGRA